VQAKLRLDQFPGKHPLTLPLQIALVSFLTLRVLSSLWIALMAAFMPVYNQQFLPLPAYLQVQNGVNHYLLAPWYRWDSVVYAAGATPLPSISPIWPPLYPLLIWVVTGVIRNPMISAMLISNTAALVFFYLFYRLTADLYSAEPARKALLLLVSFPSAFFLVAAYSESLFLALVMLFFLLLRQKKFLLCGLLYGLIVLVRLNGLVLALPLAWAGVQVWRKGEMQQPMKKLAWLAALCAGPLAFAGYALAVRCAYSVWPWQWLSSGWEQHFGLPWVGIIGNLAALATFFKGGYTPIGTTLYDLVLGGWAITWLILARKRLPVDLSLFAWGLLLISLMKVTNGNLLVSTSRYALVLFPVFMAQATSRPNRFFNSLWFAFSVFSQLLFLSLFYMGIWVG
jgi:hypothetical protein